MKMDFDESELDENGLMKMDFDENGFWWKWFLMEVVFDESGFWWKVTISSNFDT